MRAPTAQPRLLRLRARESGRPAQAPASAATAGTAASGGRVPAWALLVAALALAAITLVAVPTSPTYDPWAWLVWGRDIAEWDLNTEGGPSWKPLPVMFSVVFSLFGDDAAPYLWVWVARAGAIFALLMAWRVAARLAGGGVYGWIGGALAAMALLASFRYIRDSALGNSDALLAGLVLWSFERHLDGRRDHALYLGFAAALLRPEVWPFLGIYGLWLWLREPTLRLRMVAMAALIPLLWFLPEYLGSGDFFRAAARANTPNPNSAAFAERPSLELYDRWRPVLVTPVKLGAVIAVVWALVAFVRRRSDGPTLAFAAGGAAWFALVAAMTEAGYSGNQRYLLVTTAAVAVLGGVGLARLLQGSDWLARRLTRRRVLGWASAALAGVALLVPGLSLVNQKVEGAMDVLDLLEYEEALWQDLEAGIERAGGPEAIRNCRGIFTGPFQTQLVAWELEVHSIKVGIRDTIPPAAIWRVRNAPGSPLVPKPTHRGYREVLASGVWRLLTVPPRVKPDPGPACPSARPRGG